MILTVILELVQMLTDRLDDDPRFMQVVDRSLSSLRTFDKDRRRQLVRFRSPPPNRLIGRIQQLCQHRETNDLHLVRLVRLKVPHRKRDRIEVEGIKGAQDGGTREFDFRPTLFAVGNQGSGFDVFFQRRVEAIFQLVLRQVRIGQGFPPLNLYPLDLCFWHF